MAYCAYITRLKNVRKHPNADRLQLADCFGNTVIVDMTMKEGDLVVYFPVDGQLSEEYCRINDLVRRKDENGNPAGGYLDPDKRNIRAMRLRGERSDGLAMPFASLSYLPDAEIFEGDAINTIAGHEICCKYIPRSNGRRGNYSTSRTRKRKIDIAPFFKEHVDTEQLAYHLNDFYPGDQIEITLKMHGTSQRTGYLPILSYYKRTLWDRIRRREGTPVYEWGYVTGTRRTICDSDYEGGFYGSNEFRRGPAQAFEGKLWRGETVYYEVVGFTHTGDPIMPRANNSKIQDKEFEKKYGKETTFSYGCSRERDGVHPQTSFYVYRMTMTTPEGHMIEYSPDFMRYRCEQMCVNAVPVFARFFLDEADLEFEDRSPGEIVKEVAEHFYDGPDPIGKTHVREGVVCRIVNRPSFTAYKHKSFSFKVLEGLIKDTADAPDMEEAQENE